MSNYQEGSEREPYSEGAPTGAYPEQGHYAENGPFQGGGVPQGGGAPTGAPQYGGGGYYPGQGGRGYQPTQQFGRFPGGSHQGGGMGGRGGLSLRSTFKTTEFWIFVVVALGILIAAAVTDENADGQGFGTQDAWRYITALAIGYFISRGLTKFGGHEHDCGRHEDQHDRR
jgi:hypothetical protein